MYDPTIFDNLKVVTEGSLYDAEREGEIKIVGRQDAVDLASMGRTFRMEYEIPGAESSRCIIELSSTLPDFAAELAKLRLVEDVGPGCRLLIRCQFFGVQFETVALQHVDQILKSLWTEEIRLAHESSTVHVRDGQQYESKSSYNVEVQFPRKIDEDQMQQLEEMVRHSISTFRQLQQLIF